MIHPKEDFVAPSSASRQELQRRLQEALRSGAGPFRGELQGDTFKIWREIRYRNSFNPVVTGTIADGRVEVRQRLHQFVAVFMVVWLVPVLGMAVLMLAAAAKERAFEPVFLMPLGMAAFGALLPRLAFRVEARKNRRDLMALFASVLLATVAFGAPAAFAGLDRAASPYLRAHAKDPIHWQEWSDATLAAAAAQKKPLFVSVGFAGCHWCEVMHREAFEDLAVAKALNERYVAVLVDRQAQPEVDAAYLPAMQALAGGAGWPMNLWLNGQRQAFYAASYLPVQDRGATLGFLTLLGELSGLYEKSPEKVRARIAQVEAQAAKAAPAATGAWPAARFDQLAAHAVQAYATRFDEQHGGVKAEHKVASDLPLRFLLAEAARTREAAPRRMALTTLKEMARGALFDQLGGGFHRYAGRRDWGQPHFEKSLIDNALLIPAYLEAYQLSGDDAYRQTARRLVEFLRRDLTAPGGAFFAGVGADAAGGEGTYLWSRADTATHPLFSAYYNIGSRPSAPFWNDASAAAALRLAGSPAALAEGLEKARRELLAARGKRPQPPVDEQIITAWNGAAVSALVAAAFTLDDKDLLQAAVAAAGFVEDRLRTGGEMARTYAYGAPHGRAGLEDYAFHVAALLDLFGATGEREWLTRAQAWEDKQGELFGAADGGFYQAPAGTQLVARRKPVVDGEMPAANAVALANALRLATITEDHRYAGAEQAALRAFGGTLAAAPELSPSLLGALAAWSRGPLTVVVMAGSAPDARGAVLEPLRRRFQPERLQLLVGEQQAADKGLRALPLLAGKATDHGKTVVYMCRAGRCSLPASDAARVEEQLDHF